MIFLRRILLPVPSAVATSSPNTNYLVSNKFYFAETSREIEQKMRMQRNKALHNKFKSLNSSFGLNRPNKIEKAYAKPSTIEYTIQSLRSYSHMFPQFLLNELNNQKSQFYEVIQDSFTGLATVENKQSIQFLQFMVKWKIYLHDEQYQQILVRKIYQMKLNLNQMFSILKFVVHIDKINLKNKIMSQIQSKILNKIIEIDQFQYESLFKILNFMRINDLSPKIKPEVLEKLGQMKLKTYQSSQNEQIEYNQDSFYKVVETLLLRNLQEIPLPNLVQMIIHYANNTKQQQDDKIMILGKLQTKVLQNFPFFNHDQLIAIMYSYIKTNTHSQRLVNQFINRIQLLYFEISWENKRKILSLSSSFDHNKWIQVVGLSIFEVLKGKKVIYRDGKKQIDPQAREVEFQLLPSIYLSAYETNLATPELIDKLQTRILEKIFNYPSEDVGLIAWLFTITPPSLKPKHDNKDLLHTKLESIIAGGFNGGTFTLKDISMVVWSLCNSGGKSNSIYKQNSDFWNNIQNYIQERIGNQKEQRLFNGCCQILWAYGNNKALSLKTINLIIDLVVGKQSRNQLANEMFNFQLTTLTSFFYSLRDNLPQSINQFFEKLSLKYFTELVETMDYLEIMKMLKYTIYDSNHKISQSKLSIQLWTKVLEQFQLAIDYVQYSSIMGVVGFTIVSPQGQKTQKKAVEIVTKLMARKKRLEQLKKTTDEDK